MRSRYDFQCSTGHEHTRVILSQRERKTLLTPYKGAALDPLADERARICASGRLIVARCGRRASFSSSHLKSSTKPGAGKAAKYKDQLVDRSRLISSKPPDHAPRWRLINCHWHSLVAGANRLPIQMLSPPSRSLWSSKSVLAVVAAPGNKRGLFS